MRYSRMLIFGWLLIVIAGCSRGPEKLRPLSDVLAEYDKSIDSLKTLVKSDSMNIDLVYQLGSALTRKADFVREIHRSNERPGSLDQLFDEVIQLSRKAIARDTGSSRLYTMWGKALLSKFIARLWYYGDPLLIEEGRKALDHAIALDSASIDARMTKAQFLIMTAPWRSSLPELRPLLEPVLRQDPRNGTAYFFLTRIHSSRDITEDELGEFDGYAQRAEEYGVDDADLFLALADRWGTRPGSLYYEAPYMNRIRPIPGPVKAFFFLVANPLLSSRTDTELQAVKNALKLNPYHLEALITAARISFQKGDIDGALEYYQRSDSIDSVQTRWLGFWFPGGVEFFRKVIEKFPNSYRAYINIANRSDDSAEVRVSLEKAVALRPDLLPPYVDLAEIYINDGRYDEAEDLVSRAVASGVDSGLEYEKPAYYRLSESYAKKGQDSLMLKAYRKGLDRGSVGIYGVYDIAAVYRDRGDKKTERTVYNLYLSKMEHRKGNEFNVAMAYDELGELENAARWYEKAVNVTPDSIEGDLLAPVRKSDIYFSLANVRSRQGRYDDAIRIYEKVMKLSGNPADMYRLIGYNYRLKGDFLKARDALLKSIAESEQEVLSFYELGLTYQALKEDEKAKEAFRRAGEGGVQAAREELEKMKQKSSH